MIPNTQALGLLDLFEGAKGKEYALQWSNGSGQGQSGSIQMTDLLFNWCFYPLAFGTDGAAGTKSYRGASVRMTRRIGGPEIAYTRGPYTRKVRPTFRGGAYDTGTQLFIVDGDKLWNFEISGRLDEFRVWLDRAAATNNLKRALTVRGLTGVAWTSVPSVTQAP